MIAGDAPAGALPASALFRFAVASGITVALSGVSGTGSVGSLSPAFSLGATGVAATGSPGSLSPALSLGLTGLNATGSPGSLSPGGTFTASGVAAIGSVGDLIAIASIPLTGVGGTGSVGSMSPTMETFVALTGVSASGAIGNLNAAITLALTGVTGAGSPGSLMPVGSFGITIDSPRILTPHLGVAVATSLRIEASGGYKSSDGSAGISTTITTGSLAGKTITVKDGLIVDFS